MSPSTQEPYISFEYYHDLISVTSECHSPSPSYWSRDRPSPTTERSSWHILVWGNASVRGAKHALAGILELNYHTLFLLLGFLPPGMIFLQLLTCSLPFRSQFRTWWPLSKTPPFQNPPRGGFHGLGIQSLFSVLFLKDLHSTYDSEIIHLLDFASIQPFLSHAYKI